MPKNLLANPCGEDNLQFWDVEENGGNGWKVEDMPGDCGHQFWNSNVKKYYATSFGWCLKKQEIDLEEKGYCSEEMDVQPPIVVEDWFSGRTDCGCTYKIKVKLLDKDHKTIEKFKPEEVTIDPGKDNCSWRQVKHTFTDYGPGVRYISFKHGGTDTRFWAGWYGARVKHTFSNYGPGVRYISFEHGGKDPKYWKRWYGV